MGLVLKGCVQCIEVKNLTFEYTLKGILVDASLDGVTLSLDGVWNFDAHGAAELIRVQAAEGISIRNVMGLGLLPHATINLVKGKVNQVYMENILAKEIDALRQLAEKIEALEEDRIQAYQTLKSSLQSDGEESFTEIVAHLPAKDRDELLALYRHLKAAVIRVKASAGLLNYYVQSMSDALRQILEELFPHRKGKMYSRTGKPTEPGDESLMLYGNA